MLKDISKNYIFWIVLVIFSLLISFLLVKFGLQAVIFIIGLLTTLFLFKKIINNPFWGLIGLTFFLPFERIPTLNIGFMDLKLNQIFGGLTLISWLLLLLFEKRKIQHNFLSFPISLFLIFSLISLTQSEYLPRSILVFVFILFTIALSYLVTNLVDSKEKLIKIVQMIFFSTFVICLFAFWQLIGDIVGLSTALTGLKQGYTKIVFGFPRLQAFSMEPLYLANFLFVPLGLAVSLFLDKVDLIKRKYLYVLLAAIIIVIVLTVARSALIGLFGMILFLFVVRARRIFTVRNVVLAIASALILLTSTYYILSYSSPQAFEQFVSHVKLEDISVSESGAGRLQAFQSAIDFFQESPFIGIGLGNYAVHLQGGSLATREITNWEIVNNEYLEILTETGILGFISFILIIILLFSRSIKAYFQSQDSILKSVLIGLLAALVGILVQYNFFSTLYIIHIWFLIGLIVATRNLIISRNKRLS